MDYALLFSISAMAGSILVIFISLYLYVLYRKRYIAIWSIAWLIFFLRNIFFDSGIFTWKQSVFGFIIYQILFISCGAVFIWGTYLFVDKPIEKCWLYGSSIAVLVSATFTLLDLPLFYKIIPPAWFASIALLWIAIFFLHRLELPGIGKIITGYAFLLWSILTLGFPFFLRFSEFISLISGILRFAIANGMLIVYFEKTRADLIDKEAQYRLLAENAVDVIYRCRLSPEVKFEYISPAILAVTGYSPDEYYADARLGMSVVHPDDLPLFKNCIQDYSLANGLPFTFRLVRKDRNIVWVEQKWVAIHDPQGSILAVEGIVRDVTARKELEQIASRVDRMNMVGQMAVSVAHEIRNPLTTVRGYLQLLGRTRECVVHKERYDLLIEELDRTNEIISEYLMLAKDKMANLKHCSLNTIIRALSPLIQANAAAANVSTKIELAEIPALYLDEHEIRQLLLNLVRNAIEAMPAGGELVIRTFSEQNQVTLAVSDRGPGIPSHILDNLGMPFLTTKENGTGLGLPICYQIANRHHATIQVKTSDQGTTFFVYFNQPPAKENFTLPQPFGVGRIPRTG